jgi:nitrogen fixation protein FixH
MNENQPNRTAVRPENKSARRWPLFVVGLLVAQAIGLAVMITIATSDPSVAVEPDYYEKAVAWDLTAASRAATEALGWTATIDAGPLSGKDRELHLALVDRAGQGVTEARVHVEMFHQARSGDRLEADLVGMGAGGYVTRLPVTRPGLWEVRITARRGGDVAMLTQTLEVAARQ